MIDSRGAIVQISYLKNVESASVATAFARYDFPVPGGPYKRKALHGRLLPNTTRDKIYIIN